MWPPEPLKAPGWSDTPASRRNARRRAESSPNYA